ncbi:MAG: hypothetical protein E7583_11090 [Ruminococcaceae bacterium]|nr:hypothetical protein [Oscillospiraceae bacterium]
MKEFEVMAELRKLQIRNTEDNIKVCGTKYYVSENGNDDNDGLTPETAWKTNAKVTNADLKPGDAVLFERGGVFRGGIIGKEGVTYAAYGEGDKPKIYSSPCNAAKTGTWTLTDAPNVYVFDMELSDDVGTLVFNDGESCARKVMKVKTDNDTFGKICRDNGYDPEEVPTLNLETKEKFLDYHDLCHDLDFFHDYMGAKRVYLYSDKGNPSERFDGIELLVKVHVIRMAKHTHIDNLCIKYGGAHGVCGGNFDITVTNCEFGWIGGSIQAEDIFGRPHPTRYGNAVELYGNAVDYTVDNCYFYQVYDASITHQSAVREDNIILMENIAYTNNLIETSSYSIEYFLGKGNDGNPSHMRNVLMKNNLCIDAGFGWGNQRPDKDTPAHIKGWRSVNRAMNFVIEDNIFIKSRYMMIECGTEMDVSRPIFRNNTYVQFEGGQYGMAGNENKRRMYDAEIEDVIRGKYGETDAKIYFIKNN